MAAVDARAASSRRARERSLRQRHPWLFSGAIARVDGDPGPGDDGDASSAADGAFLALCRLFAARRRSVRASGRSIRDEAIDAAFFDRRIEPCRAARATLLERRRTPAHVLVHGESDGLAGRHRRSLRQTSSSSSCSSAGAERWREAIAAAHSRHATGARCVYERSDADVRTAGRPARRAPASLTGVLPRSRDDRRGRHLLHASTSSAVRRPASISISATTARTFARTRQDRRVLNAFCYTGGFTLAALAGGATSRAVDRQRGGRARARRARICRAIPRSLPIAPRGARRTCSPELRRLRDAGAQFDLIVLDPPKFAPTAAHVERAARAYKDINLLGAEALPRRADCWRRSRARAASPPTCSRRSSPARRSTPRADAAIVGQLRPRADHPVALNFPRATTSKGLLVRKVPDSRNSARRDLKNKAAKRKPLRPYSCDRVDRRSPGRIRQLVMR